MVNAAGAGADPGAVDANLSSIWRTAEAIAAAGMDMPFLTQMVLFEDQTEETDGDRIRQREGWPAGDAPPKPRPLSRLELVKSDTDDGRG